MKGRTGRILWLCLLWAGAAGWGYAQAPATPTESHVSAAPEVTTPADAPPAPSEVSTAVITSTTTAPTPEFGPVVRAYLSYLQDEQEVVDDRNSRHELAPAFYRRNTNRIRALRTVALRLARETANDYLPELVAVEGDEFHTIFLEPPAAQSLQEGVVYSNTFRYLGLSSSGGIRFYIFARLDPYEQEELLRHRAAPEP